MTRSNLARTTSLARSSSPRIEPVVVEHSLDSFYIQMGKDLLASYKAGAITKTELKIKWDLMKAEYSALRGAK
jgi:hypothetical protein